jgi:hypothetical protein
MQFRWIGPASLLTVHPLVALLRMQLARKLDCMFQPALVNCVCGGGGGIDDLISNKKKIKSNQTIAALGKNLK